MILAVFTVISFCILLTLNLEFIDEDQLSMLRLIFLEMCTATMLLFIATIFACKRPMFIDFYGFSILLAFVVVIYVYYLTPSMQIQGGGPNSSNLMFGVFYFINSHFMSSNFLLTFILRQVLTWTFLCFNVVM